MPPRRRANGLAARRRRFNVRVRNRRQALIAARRARRNPGLRRRPSAAGSVTRNKVHVKAKTASAYGPSFHKVNAGRSLATGKVRTIIKGGSKNSLINTSSFGLSCIQAAQASAELVYFSRIECRAMATNMGIAGADANNNNNTADWVIEKGYFIQEITNSSNVMCFCDIYFFKCIRDTSSSPFTLWQEGVQEQENNNGVTVNRLGLVPINIDRLALFWKLKKVIHHCLLPGQVHRQAFEIKMNKLIHNEILYAENDADRGRQFLAGITYGTIMIIRGQPASDVTAGNVTHSTAPTKLVWLDTRTYYTSYLQDATYNSTVSSNILGYNNPFVYNQGSGAITTVQTV